MNDWEKFLERRKANIGFSTRGKAFRAPTEGEKAQAMAIEIKSWQESQGKKNYTVSLEYKISKGMGFNLLTDRELGVAFKGENVSRAIDAYINTPMDKEGILKSQGIDTQRFKWREIGIFRALWSWIIGRKVRRKYDES